MSFLQLKKAYSCSDATHDTPLKYKTMHSLNFDHNLPPHHIDIEQDAKSKSKHNGDRFIPSSVSTKAYTML